MPTSTEKPSRLRALLEAAAQEKPNCTCKSPQVAHEESCPWLRWMYENPQNKVILEDLAPTLADDYLKAVEALGKLQSLPLLMTSWEKSSRDAAYDEIQDILKNYAELEATLGERHDE